MKNAILIVDDSRLNRETLADILKDKYNIIEAEDGRSGLEVLEKRKDHIVLCFRNCCNLLRTVAKSFSEKSTGSNRIKSLQNLIAASGKPFIDTVRPEVTAYSFKDLQIIF